MSATGSLPALPDVAALPAGDAARRIARALLEQTLASAGRLGSEDGEALHDVRVALRRLRAHLRAHGDRIGIGSHERERLKDIAASTGHLRDLEVQIAWLESHADDDAAGRAAARLAAELRDEATRKEPSVRRTLADRLPPERDRLLLLLRARRNGDADEPLFAATVARAALDNQRRLAKKLRGVRSVRDQDRAHDARIAAKRVRYLIEPLESASERARNLVVRMRKIQDVLGEMHDAHVLRGFVRARAEAATGPDGDALRELARTLKRERKRLFRKARRQMDARATRKTRRWIRRLGRELRDLRPAAQPSAPVPASLRSRSRPRRTLL